MGVGDGVLAGRAGALLGWPLVPIYLVAEPKSATPAGPPLSARKQSKPDKGAVVASLALRRDVGTVWHCVLPIPLATESETGRAG